MKRKITFGLLVFLLLAGASSFGQSQGELNDNAIKQHKSADSTLNSIYNLILSLYSSDSTFIENLKTAQQLWIKFRDAELEMKFPDSYSYGSVQPMCISLFLVDLINDRIKTLRTWLDGVEEGDVCAGSVNLHYVKSNCQLMIPDTSVFGIILLDAKSSIKQVGIMKTTHEPKNDLPHLNYCTQDKKQTMTLYIHPGGGVNEVSEFQVTSYSATDSAKTLMTNSFETGKGVKLGISKEKVVAIFGNCYKTITTKKNNLEIIKYHIDDINSKFLVRFNYPSYYAEYEFFEDKLVRFRFGFDYP